MALRIGRLDDSSLIARKLCNIRVITVASPRYLAEQGTPQHWRDLSLHSCVIDTNFRDPQRWWFSERDNLKVDMHVNGRLKFSNTEVCLQCACEGFGITRLPTFIASSALRSGAVVPVLAEYEVPPMELYAVYPHSRHLAQKSRAFVEYLAESFAGEPAWDQGW